MKGHYQKVPDTTRKKTFPKARIEPNQYKESIGPHKPTVGERILTAAGDFNRAIAPHLEKGAQMGGKVQRYAAHRSEAINMNFGMNPMGMGANWANMSFPDSGFGEPAPRRRKRHRSRR